MQLQDKLRKLYASEKINIMVPVHVGQNTSQMANRINQYLELYKPKLLIIMAGCNNEWSLAESHVLRFLAHDDLETLKVKAMLFLDNFRIFKLAKYLYLKLANKGIAEYLEQNRYYFLGPPEICRFPPEKWVYSFAIRDQQAFRRLWRYDIRMIIEAAKAKNVRVLLMTYHINPAYLPVREFLDMSDNEHVALIRNDLSFIELAGRNELGGFILQDGWHPNSKGYSLIANNAFCGIRDNDLLGLNAKASGYLSKYER
jgi:lysophospholipase L1-like esterase